MKSMGRLGLLFLAAVLVTGGTVVAGAAFTDTDPISANTAQAATFDLKVGASCQSMADSASGAIVVQNMAPGVMSGKYWFCYKNSSNSDASGKIKFEVSYTECDAPELGEFAGQEVGATNFAKHLWIVDASLSSGMPSGLEYWWAQQIIDECYGGTQSSAISAGAVAICNSSQVPTMYGMSLVNYFGLWSGYPTGWDGSTPAPTWVKVNPGQCHCNDITLMLDPCVGNAYQDDGIEVTIDVTMEQYSMDVACPQS